MQSFLVSLVLSESCEEIDQLIVGVRVDDIPESSQDKVLILMIKTAAKEVGQHVEAIYKESKIGNGQHVKQSVQKPLCFRSIKIDIHFLVLENILVIFPKAMVLFFETAVSKAEELPQEQYSIIEAFVTKIMWPNLYLLKYIAIHLKERFNQLSSFSFYVHILGLPADLFYSHHSFLSLNDSFHQLNVLATALTL